jgi:hypothetical protein
VKKILHLVKQRAGVLLKNQTSWSEQDPFPTALEQRHAKTRFQIPHLLRNTRLRNSEPVSRAAKTPRLGDREKIPEMANIQGLRHARNNIVRPICKMQSGA